MRRARYDDYVRGFNREDLAAFDEYHSPELLVINGKLEIHGLAAVKRHYSSIWPSFRVVLVVERFVSDAETLAVQMWTRFTARVNDPRSLFGPVKVGELFDFRGVTMYRIEDGRFTEIRVAYNSFIHTSTAGVSVDLGIPH
jgi:hypothetical protein